MKKKMLNKRVLSLFSLAFLLCCLIGVASARAYAEQDKSKETDIWARYLKGKSIQAIAVGKDCLWLGTDTGLILFSKKKRISVTRYSKADGLPGSDVQAVKVHKGEVWIGTRDGGLSRFDGTKFTNYGKDEGLFDTRVMALDVDEENVWLGLCFGVSRFEKKTETFRNHESPEGFVPQAGLGSAEDVAVGDPRRICADSILADGQNVWHGAWNTHMSNHSFTKLRHFRCGPLPASRVTSLCKVGKHIYIGIMEGLSRVDTATFKVKNFYQKNGLLSDSILALAADGKFLWIGSDLGITRFDVRTDKCTNFGPRHGYKWGHIFCMAVDKNYVWIGTMEGLVRLDKRATPRVGAVLDDFEGPKRTCHGVPSQHVSPSGLKQIFFLDSTTGANGSKSSVCITYKLPPEPAEVRRNYHCFDFWCPVERNLAPYEGFTFFVKAEGPFLLDKNPNLVAVLIENRRPGPELRVKVPKEEFHIDFTPVLGKWVRVVIPFTAFPMPGSGSSGAIVNGILELRKVGYIYFEWAFDAWHPGEEMKFWIDEISLYKKGEFVPTVPEGTMAVDRGTWEEREEQVLSIGDLPIKEKISPREASYYVQLSGNRVQCQLCPNQCILRDGERGICRVRQNIGGKLSTLVYGQPCALAIDPIEKGPIFHMTPGAKSLVVATAGCNLNCKYCQNWQFALVKPEETRNYDLPPEKAVQLALDNGCEAIVFTYSEATVSYEYMLDVAKLAKERGLKTVLITAGYINPKPLRQLCRYLDAIKVDLKGFTEDFYKRVCSAELQPVLKTLKVIKEEGVCLEIVNLVVPTLNDDIGQIRQMCKWIRENLGRDTPLHFSRFWPSYKLLNLMPTPVEVLEQAIQVAKDAGLKYVYIGNVPGHEAANTYCPKCGKCLVKRIGYAAVGENNIVDGKCKFCGERIPGVWK